MRIRNSIISGYFILTLLRTYSVYAEIGAQSVQDHLPVQGSYQLISLLERRYQKELQFIYPKELTGHDVDMISHQSKAWRVTLRSLGDKLRHQHGIDQAYFLNGTFIGTDGLGTWELIERILFMIEKKIEYDEHKDDSYLNRMKLTLRKKTLSMIKQSFTFLKQTKVKTAHSFHGMIKDQGNFLPAYIRTFSQATGISGRAFLWGSGNYHWARVQAAIRLLLRIDQDISASVTSKNPIDHILIYGHSHGGQVMALLSHLLGLPDHNKKLNSILDITLNEFGLFDTNQANNRRDKITLKQVKGAIKRLRRLKVTYVTFGTPRRYTWTEDPKNMTLLNFVNHRPDPKGKIPDYRTGALMEGLWSTTAGDYIHQVGITGSDFIHIDLKGIHAANQKLGVFLGTPIKRIDRLLNEIDVGLRVPDVQFGYTLLVDYEDQGQSPLDSLFGHGRYTMFRYMLFTLQQLSLYLDRKAKTYMKHR